MTRTWPIIRNVAPARLLALGALVCAIPLLAGCVGDADDDVDGAAGTEPATAAGSPAADDEVDGAARDLLATFEPDIAGLERRADRTPLATAAEIFGTGIEEVEPAACLPVFRGVSLATAADLGAAGDDPVQPHPPYLPGGEFPEDGGIDQLVTLTTRVFGDPALAETIIGDMLDAECDGYVTRSEWDTGAHTSEDAVQGVAEVTLAGLASPTVRVQFSGGTATGYDAAGEVVGEDTRGAWNDYVHVHGSSGIAVSVIGMPDPDAVAAQVIADFLDHMDPA